MKYLSKILLTACAAASSLFLTGCASSFNVGESELSCPGGIGLPCMDARTVHERTNNMQPGDSRRGLNGSQDAYGTGTKVVAPFYSAPIPNYPSIDQPMPVMAGAQVMRIWVNAWQDNRGDLVYPSYVFTEVTPRRWNVGNSAARGISTKRVSPLIIEQASDSTGTDSAASTTTAAAAPSLPPTFTNVTAPNPSALQPSIPRPTNRTPAPAVKRSGATPSVVPPLSLPN
jgi:conjugal transfer pilus assembly protein TraV